MSDKFSTEFQIYTYQSDSQEYARPGSLFGFFIEAASMHATNLGVGHIALRKKHNAFWALSKFHMDIIETPRWHQTIKITTWPSGYNRLFAHRYFVFTDSEGKLLAQGVSDWVIMDFNTRALCNAETILSQVPAFNLEEEHLDIKNIKVPTANEEFSASSIRQAMFSHLDMNNHVNSVHYLDWSLDCIEHIYICGHRPIAVDINFQHEISLGESVKMLCQNTEPDTFIITGRTDSHISFSAKIRFQG